MSYNLHDIRNKISVPELVIWEERFRALQAPNVMQQLVETLSNLIGDHLVDSSRSQFCRDAYIASKFALGRAATLVQLLSPTKNEAGQVDPDFQIKVGECWYRYESVEVVGRENRSDEIREDRENGGRVRDEHIADCAELTATSNSAVAKKAAKASTYAGCTGLVVLLNLWALMDHEEKVRAFMEGTASAGKAFEEVWILKLPEMHQIWAGGHAVFK